MNKVYPSADEAIRDVFDGMTLLSGGFGLCGNPENLILALHRKGTKDLSIISNNCGTTEHGLGILLRDGRVRKMTSSYVGENKHFAEQFLSGTLEVELNPQGTLSERMRAGGAGIPAFFTPTGYGTAAAEGKETREIDGRMCVLEHALKGDFAFVKAQRGDRAGNLVFNKAARNFNPEVAMAGKITIAEVEELVDVGEIDPDDVHLSGIYVQRIIKGEHYEKWIERLTVRSAEEN